MRLNFKITSSIRYSSSEPITSSPSLDLRVPTGVCVCAQWTRRRHTCLPRGDSHICSSTISESLAQKGLISLVHLSCPVLQTEAVCPHEPSHPPQLTYSFTVMAWRSFTLPEGLA